MKNWITSENGVWAFVYSGSPILFRRGWIEVMVARATPTQALPSNRDESLSLEMADGSRWHVVDVETLGSNRLKLFIDSEFPFEAAEAERLIAASGPWTPLGGRH